ncbi:MAG: spore coat protein [Bacilli bacterium]|nr:spore coat protein [Bacilli bacterium]
MRLNSTEVCQLKELLMSCTNTITCMSFFMKQVKNQELSDILSRQFPMHVEDYNMKALFLKEENGPQNDLSIPEQIGLQADLSVGVPMEPVTPNTDTEEFNDRQIATNYLLTLKRAGKEYAGAAMEAAHPKLREFLKDAFTLSCNHAYEVWEWMLKNEYYDNCPEEPSKIEKVANSFNVVE